jgi:type IV secretory pathway VirB4 component
MLVTEAGCVAVFAVTGYPAQVHPGWLDPLLGYPGRVDVSVHIDPVDPLTAADRLRKQLARLEAGRRHAAEHNKLPDPLVEAATEDAHALASRVARGEGRLLRFGLYLAVHAPDPATLAEEVAALRALAGSLLCDTRPASYRQWQGWTSCLPFGCDELGTRRVMDTAAVAATFPFTSPDLPTPDPLSGSGGEGVLYGFNLGSSGLVCWDRFAADNHNAVILGSSGSGKSYFTKLELLRSLYRGVHGYVIDPEDEYTRLTTAVGGAVIRLGAPGVSFNPLDLPLHRDNAGRLHTSADAVHTRALFLHTFLTALLGVELDPTERAVLDDAIATTYTAAGITPDDPAGWSRPAPLLADLGATLADDPDPAGRGLAARLRPYSHGAHSRLFQAPTSTTPAGALVSFSLRALPEELRPAATMLVLDHIWRQVNDTATPRRRLVVIDEAWMLMRHPATAGWLFRMAKQFRKRWAGLSFTSQDVADVLGTELGQAVITNSATQILLRQAPQTIEQVTRTFALSAGERAFLLRAGQGEALLTGGTHRVAFRAHASTNEDRLIRTDPEFLASLPDSDDAGTVYLTDPDTDTGGTDSDRRRPVYQRAIEEHQRRRRGGS